MEFAILRKKLLEIASKFAASEIHTLTADEHCQKLALTAVSTMKKEKGKGERERGKG